MQIKKIIYIYIILIDEFFEKKHLDNTNLKNKSSKYLYESDKKNFDNFKLDINTNSNDFISDFNNRRIIC